MPIKFFFANLVACSDITILLAFSSLAYNWTSHYIFTIHFVSASVICFTHIPYQCFCWVPFLLMTCRGSLQNLQYQSVVYYNMYCPKSLESCPILCDFTDCCPPGSSVHEDSQYGHMPYPPPEDVTDPWIKPTFLYLLHWQPGSLQLAAPENPYYNIYTANSFSQQLPFKFFIRFFLENNIHIKFQ